jgi:hypothetical protein
LGKTRADLKKKKKKEKKKGPAHSKRVFFAGSIEPS